MTNQTVPHIQPAPAKQIATVNGKLAVACIFGGVAYLLWPSSAYWYPFYVFSVLLGAAACVLAVQAIILIHNIRKFERDQRAFEALGAPVKTATLAQEDFLTKEGVIRDVK